MVNIRLFLFFFKKENLFNLLLFFSVPSLLFMGDIFLLFYLTQLLGMNLAISLFFFFTALGQFILFKSFSVLLDRLMTAKEASDNCTEYYLAYAGTLPSLVYLIYPGIISTLIGSFLLLPLIRKKMGKGISSFFKIDWDEINEYLFLLQ
jgi:UPF0716 family protein affecting phage T7 exclusion